MTTDCPVASLSPATLISSNMHLTNICVGALIFSPATASTPRKLLLIQRSARERAFPYCWEIPGGGCEISPTRFNPHVDATLGDAVVREVKEETGLTVTRIVRAVPGWLEFPGWRRNWRKYTFEVEVADGEEVKLDPKEHENYIWVSQKSEVDGLNITSLEQRGVIIHALEGTGVAHLAGYGE